MAQVNVSLSPDGDLFCSKIGAVQKGDEVEWRCAQGLAFSIDFGWDTPFPEEQYRMGANAGGVSIITAIVDKVDGAKHGRRMKFKYTIAALGNAGAVAGVIVMDDPEIIIDP
jgi:hypothetical protein